MDKLKIAIVGATGYVARNLRRHLSTSPDIHMVSIARRQFDTFPNETSVILDTATISSSRRDVFPPVSQLQGCDVMVTLIGAGRQSARDVATSYEESNVGAVRRAVDMCRSIGIKKLIYLSGLGVSPDIELAYFISKFRAEQLIKRSGLEYTIFRPSYIVGNNDHLHKLLLEQAHTTKEITLPGSGNYNIQPIHIDDVSKIILNSFTSQRLRNKTVDLVGPDPIKLLQYFRIYAKLTDARLTHVDMELTLHCAVTHPAKSLFSTDDIGILVGGFVGDYYKLVRLTGVTPRSILKILKSRNLP